MRWPLSVSCTDPLAVFLPLRRPTIAVFLPLLPYMVAHKILAAIAATHQAVFLPLHMKRSSYRYTHQAVFLPLQAVFLPLQAVFLPLQAVFLPLFITQ